MRFTYLAVLLGALVCSLGGTALSSGTAHPGKDTLRQQLRRAKPALAAQPTLADYHQSPDQPSTILDRVRQLEIDSAWTELCRELALLPDEELELFEDGCRTFKTPCLFASIGQVW